MANGSPEKAPNLQNQILGTTIITSHLFETGCKLKISSFSFQVGTKPVLGNLDDILQFKQVGGARRIFNWPIFERQSLWPSTQKLVDKKLKLQLTKGNCPVEGYNSSDILLFKT